MDETIEKIVDGAMDEVSGFGGDDQYMIMERVSQRLHEEARRVLVLEYSDFGGRDDEQA